MRLLLVLVVGLLPLAALAQQLPAPRFQPPAANDNSEQAATTGWVQSRLATRMPLVGADISGNPDIALYPFFSPFGTNFGKMAIYSARTAEANAIGVTTMLTRKTPGSGAFGPQAADVALMIHAEKTDAATATGRNAREGEIDALIVTGIQGKRGDLGGYIADLSKRRDNLTSTAPDETGGIVMMEGNVELRNAAGRPYHRMHPMIGFAESPAGLSGGRGYGFVAETRAGTWFSAFHAGSTAGDFMDETRIPAANAWQYYFSGAQNRTGSSVNFLVANDGSIAQGFPTARTSFAYDASQNAWILKDEAGQNMLRVGRTAKTVDVYEGLTINNQYGSLVFKDPATRPSAGGHHRISSAGNGTVVYQVSTADNRFETAAVAFAVGPAGVMTVNKLAIGAGSPKSDSPCAAGQKAWDTNYEYTCVATNRWKRRSIGEDY